VEEAGSRRGRTIHGARAGGERNQAGKKHPPMTDRDGSARTGGENGPAQTVTGVCGTSLAPT
jgi:hypothetical protein